MTKYRKKPIVIEAMQYNGSIKEAFDLHEFCPDAFITPKEVIISTLEGDMTAAMGDWIITGVEGEFDQCNSSIFEATY